MVFVTNMTSGKTVDDMQLSVSVVVHSIVHTQFFMYYTKTF